MESPYDLQLKKRFLTATQVLTLKEKINKLYLTKRGYFHQKIPVCTRRYTQNKCKENKWRCHKSVKIFRAYYLFFIKNFFFKSWLIVPETVPA